ncbi:neo-calmodulin-like isoform X3 [Pomacea canaliculata]|uniref:neo-calmodulin-like isoform X3 n=1 Tax=Pomacea canaliculata TaxID=400727 RepID=UPI000D73254F|nr:neo-calmodulin-like isoform X3 [Pomacea canaliculata]
MPIFKAKSKTSQSQSKKKEKDMETEIRELFRSFDRNHDNTICAGELGKVLRCLGMNVSEADVQQIIKELDKNRNGKIEYKEFKAFMQEEMRKAEDPAEQEKAVRMAFRVFDQNGDGFIDVKELQNAMKNLGEPLTDKELTDMMKEADMDKDGKINYEEFIRVWIKSGKKK